MGQVIISVLQAGCVCVCVWGGTVRTGAVVRVCQSSQGLTLLQLLQPTQAASSSSRAEAALVPLLTPASTACSNYAHLSSSTSALTYM